MVLHHARYGRKTAAIPPPRSAPHMTRWPNTSSTLITSTHPLTTTPTHHTHQPITMALRCPQMQLSRPGLQRPRHTRSVVVSAEKGAKPVREYQEETGEITAADGADNNPAKKVPLYADSVTMVRVVHKFSCIHLFGGPDCGESTKISQSPQRARRAVAATHAPAWVNFLLSLSSGPAASHNPPQHPLHSLVSTRPRSRTTCRAR